MSSNRVNVDNFTRVETNRMFASMQAMGSVGVFTHWREPSPLDKQAIIRLNRDTLYSSAIVDITEGADLVMPDGAGRYVSVMVINQDHFINRIYHEAGTYHLSMEEFETPFVMIGVRILVDPADPADILAVNALQDQFDLHAASNEPFVLPDYDEASHRETHDALIELARGLDGFSESFGTKEEVAPVHHLIGTAAGWGGLPTSEVIYLNVDPKLPVGEYQITVGDVPVDGFWSISLYNAEGYFEPNSRNLYNINSLTAEKNSDGTTTVNFGTSDQEKPNYFPIMEGWNYLVRLYRPHPEIQAGTWSFPSVEPV